MAFHRVVASAAAVGSTMEILMRGVCIICAYTGVNYTLPTSVVELYSRGCYDIKYIPSPGRPTRCDIIYNSRLYYHAPARGRFGSTVPQGTKDCATWVALPPAPCSLSPILISYSTLYSIQCSVIGSRSSGLPGRIVLRLSTGRAVYVRGTDILVVSNSATRPLKLYYPS